MCSQGTQIVVELSVLWEMIILWSEQFWLTHEQTEALRESNREHNPGIPQKVCNKNYQPVGWLLYQEPDGRVPDITYIFLLVNFCFQCWSVCIRLCGFVLWKFKTFWQHFEAARGTEHESSATQSKGRSCGVQHMQTQKLRRRTDRASGAPVANTR